MRKEARLFSIVTLLLFFNCLNFGQDELIIEDFSTTGEFLEVAIEGDTPRPEGRVYVLRRGGTYYMSISLDIVDYTLRIKAEDGPGAKPVIYAFRNTEGNYNAQIFNVSDAIELTNLSLVGWAEGTEDFDRNATRLINVAAQGGSIVVDSCILFTASATLIQTSSRSSLLKVTNTVFSHSANLVQTNIGNGRAIEFRDVGADSVYVQNCSFINFTDRVVRHYNAVAAISSFFLDHCTFVNILAEHGCIVLGRIEGNVTISNNLFHDNFMFGNDSTATQSDGRLAEFQYVQEYYPNGQPRMTFVGSVPNDTTDINWTIYNNYYSVSPSLQTFWDNHSGPPLGDPGLDELIPLTWHINSKLGADSVNAFTKVADPIVFDDVPETPIDFCDWYFTPQDQGGAGKTKSNATFSLEIGFDRRDIAYFDGTLDLKFQQTSEAFTGADGDLPAGDLNWWTGIVGVEREEGIVPETFSLEQNFPNPFNPSTKIVYNIPKESKVKIEVFDVLGRHVAILVNETQIAGKYTVDFDAAELSSGVYVYQLTTQNQILSKKMLLLK